MPVQRPVGQRPVGQRRLVAALALLLGAVVAAGFALSAHDRRGRGPGAGTGVRYAVGALEAPRPPARPDAQRRWSTRTAARVDVPPRALLAYGRAVREAPRDCGISWTTVAGVGAVESRHGTLGGRTLGPRGRSSTPIIGPALDGRGSFAAIRSTPTSAALHGDPVWEHAVGPMQFLPGTWARWGVDADHDGRADPLDLDDAAAAAARFLCSSGRSGLGTSLGWERAVLAYNHSGAYADQVYAEARGYARHARPRVS